MKRHDSKIIILMVLFFFIVTLAADGPVRADASFDVEVTVPATVTPPISFTLIIKAVNKTGAPLNFNKVAVAYAPNDNLTFAGPYEIWTGTPSWTSAPPYFFPTATISVPMQIISTKSSDSIVPLAVTLWENNYSTPRGGTATGLKIKR